MKKRTQKSQKRTKFLLLLLVLTAILSITATYAWFSTQRDVEITGMRLNVEVAENMQISLDGATWVQSITISDMRQFYGTASGDTLHQAVKVGTGTNTNYVPKELLPVSSVGTNASGTLKFVTGTVGTGTDGKTSLTKIKACSEASIASSKTIAERETGNDAHPYLVFDMYLRNISAGAAGTLDTLYLNENSKVWINTASKDDQEGEGKEGTGLEYSARVGFIKYGNTVSVTAEDTTEDDVTTTVAEQVRRITSNENDQVAIWEPNHLNHTPYVVNNKIMGITSYSQAVTTLAIKDTVDENATITDIYDSSDTTNLTAVKTFTPAYDTDGLEAAKEIEILTSDGSTKYMGLEPNAISKVRVYVWLEGQDPECNNDASTGDKLNINLRFWRDKNKNGSSNTYDTAASTNTNTN